MPEQIKEGLRIALNEIRTTSIQNNTLYHTYVPEILPTTSIGEFATPILEMPELRNEFVNQLVQRIVYTQIYTKYFNNPLRVLEGDRIPLGAIGQEIYVNPAKGRKFNVKDFAGLLAQYDADVKVQYHNVNSDIQYPVTISRAKLKTAFTSWRSLEEFITSYTQSLYNGAYIDAYNLTKGLVTSAYNTNQVHIQTINKPTSKVEAEQFITLARTLFLNMQTPTSDFNAWAQVGGYGNEIITWTDPNDIIFLLRSDIASYIDVQILASSFNIDKSILLGNIIYVNDFNIYDEQNNLIQDGSKILGIMADKSWFRIKDQDMEMDNFYNANNRTWQYYLNLTRMYSYSLFANAVVFATEAPSISITNLNWNSPEGITINGLNEEEGLEIDVTPPTATTPSINYAVGDNTIVKLEQINERNIKVTSLKTGTTTLTATAGNVTASTNITVTNS